jgi:lysophospholipase L1-like esterase
MNSMHLKRWTLPFYSVALVGALAFTFQQGSLPETVKPVIDEAPMKAHSYDWMARHNAVVERVQKGNVDLILVGDSITMMWGGVPEGGGPGYYLWDKYFGSRNAVNLGFGWDRTQHVLWRLENGEIDGIHPKVAVVMIGTNNLGANPNEDIVTGIDTVVSTIRRKLPKTKILVLGIFPRDPSPTSWIRKQVTDVNSRISVLGKEKGITYLDLTSIFLEPDGTISKEIMGDYLHPTPKGFGMWARAMEPTLAKLFGDKPRE